MSITMTITAEDHTQFAQHLAGVMALAFPRIPSPHNTAPVNPAPTPAEVQASESGETPAEQPAEKKKRGRPAGSKNEPETPAEQPAADKPSEKPADEAEKPKAITQADVKARLLALMEAKGDEAPVNLLKEFSVAKISEVKADDYAKVIARVSEMMGAD